MAKKKISHIYEINTRIWLKELSHRYQSEIKLDTIPDEEITGIRKFGFDAVWLMGVWRSSGRGRDIALHHEGLRSEFLKVFPDLKPEDIGCSPYSVAGYEIDSSLGDRKSILDFKKRLNRHGIKLLLDFVPNHVALDHPWVKTKPQLFINGSEADIRNNPETFFTVDNYKTIVAYGKDPYFPAWTDVAQLNYFNPQTRKSIHDVVLSIAQLCDGLRCDMAMLILKRIQREIWGDRVFNSNKFDEPDQEFWQEVIVDVKQSYPGFIFIAEVYWGLETELLLLGFDYAYDKPFYDALKEMDIGKLKGVLTEHDDVCNKNLRFIENHDEDRAVTAFGVEKSMAAALIMTITPGVQLFHQGQLEGFKIRLPVQLIRRPEEKTDQRINSFYKMLLSNTDTIMQGDNSWILLEPSPAWEGNRTNDNFIGVFNSNHFLLIINYSASQSQCYLHLPVADIFSGTENLTFEDMANPVEYIRSREEIVSRGLYLDITPYGFHLFKVSGEHE
ncbi:MAG: alpha-amylase family glycosyl hydrolase [Candidatus Scalindua sp.]|nr:alpha-amylase family glycosyl hydrolase [Candidatus Scalindua sp.]